MAKKQPAVPVNPLDAIAQTAKPTSKKTAHPVAEVTDDIRLAVDAVIAAKANITKLEHDLAEAETVIIDHVRPQQDEAARNGKFSKSFSVEGIQGNVLYVTSDKFSIPKDQINQDHVKDLVGDKWFAGHFRKVRTVALKPAVSENIPLLKRIIDACAKDGIPMSEAFDVTDSLVAEPGLDVAQYELEPEVLAEFRTLVKQYKPAIK